MGLHSGFFFVWDLNIRVFLWIDFSFLHHRNCTTQFFYFNYKRVLVATQLAIRKFLYCNTTCNVLYLVATIIANGKISRLQLNWQLIINSILTWLATGEYLDYNLACSGKNISVATQLATWKTCQLQYTWKKLSCTCNQKLSCNWKNMHPLF
jgi:hypothetical protein